MLRFFSTICFFILIISLSGCHSLTFTKQKEYFYIAPHSVADKRCVNKCVYARKYCLRICELKNSSNCDCATSFNTCYTACGGQVIER